MKKLIELGKALFIIGTITGIIPALLMGLVYTIFE